MDEKPFTFECFECHKDCDRLEFAICHSCYAKLKRITATARALQKQIRQHYAGVPFSDMDKTGLQNVLREIADAQLVGEMVEDAEASDGEEA